MTINISFSTDYTSVDCCHDGCGITWLVPLSWERQRRQDHTAFYCPNGHRQFFLGETKAEKLQRELNNAKQQIARAEDEAREAQAAARKAVAAKARLEKRVHNGVCPCCSRSFANLKRHMASKHPNVTPLKVSA